MSCWYSGNTLACKATEESSILSQLTMTNWLDEITHEGYAPCLVFDDDGHWAVSFSAFQPVPGGDGEGFSEQVIISIIVEKDEWKNSIEEAIEYAKNKMAR